MDREMESASVIGASTWRDELHQAAELDVVVLVAEQRPLIATERLLRQVRAGDLVALVERGHRRVGGAERHHRRRGEEGSVSMATRGGVVDECSAGARIVQRFTPTRADRFERVRRVLSVRVISAATSESFGAILRAVVAAAAPAAGSSR